MLQFSFPPPPPQKKKKTETCFDRNLPCFVSLNIHRSRLVLVAHNKTNIQSLFLFTIEIIHPQ